MNIGIYFCKSVLLTNSFIKIFKRSKNNTDAWANCFSKFAKKESFFFQVSELAFSEMFFCSFINHAQNSSLNGHLGPFEIRMKMFVCIFRYHNKSITGKETQIPHTKSNIWFGKRMESTLMAFLRHVHFYFCYETLTIQKKFGFGSKTHSSEVIKSF